MQWCGVVYAYSLALLSPYDTTLDWRHIAEGILLAGEQMQHTQGEFVGCLPDAFELGNQQKLPANINPSALVSLRLRLRGELDSLSVAADHSHRVAAPFKVKIRNGNAYIDAIEGTRYQVLVDGERVIDVVSKGKDVISLE